jgi:hypothetical protein
MTIQEIKDTIRAEVRKLTTWGKVALLAALPFASDIKDTLTQQLPALQPYVPENIYKFMGGAVVVLGIILSLVASHRAVKAANDA